MSADPIAKAKINVTDTPKFGNPPVIETILGVQFKPLLNMHIAHLGQFRQTVDAPGDSAVRQVPILPHQIEHEEQLLQSIPFPMFGPAVALLPRIWILFKETKEGQQLIQLQNDKLLQNWRRGTLAGAVYTSYSRNSKTFLETYRSFLEFAKNSGLGDVELDQCEVAYVNHISIDDFTSTSEAYKKCFKSFAAYENCLHVPSQPNSMGFSSVYWLEELTGRLYVEASTALVAPASKRVINLQITARGTPAEKSIDGIKNWLDYGHYFVTNAFADLTTNHMHDKWEMKK